MQCDILNPLFGHTPPLFGLCAYARKTNGIFKNPNTPAMALTLATATDLSVHI